MFGLFGMLFLATQFLQFSLGCSALGAGVRMLPAAGAIAVIAPLSTLCLRVTTVRYAIAAGLLFIAGGLWQVSGATVVTTYTDILPGVILLGVGAGLAIPAATESVMGWLPNGDTGVGSATNGAFLQTGGALGVAIIGSLLNTRYTNNIDAALASHHVPSSIAATIRGSLGGALQVAARWRPARRGPAARAGGQLGAELAHVAKSAFVSGMDLGLLTGAFIALGGCLVALVDLPKGRTRS
jgi:hypothetical protein